MNTCGNCKHWEYHDWKSYEQLTGCCNNQKVFSNFHATLDEKDNFHNGTPIDGLSCNGYNTKPENRQYVKTGRNFGCIHHSKNM